MEDKLHLELVKFEDELSKLKTAVEYIEAAKTTAEAAAAVISDIIKLKTEFEKFARQTEILIGKIDKVDFPSRLDKLDSTVAAINQNISNVQARIESLERNLKDEIKTGNKNVHSEIQSKFNSLSSHITKLSTSSLTNRWISIIGFVIIIMILVYIVVK